MLALEKKSGHIGGIIQCGKLFWIFAVLIFSVGATNLYANPYAAYLNSYFTTATVPSMPTVMNPLPATWDAWQCRTVATDMSQRAWALCDPLSTASSSAKATFQTQIQTEMTWLIQAQSQNPGRWWWSGCGFKGDDNTDRFVLTEMLDTINRLKNAGLFTGTISSWLTSLSPAVTYQYNTYGANLGVSGQLCGFYPNMDAAYTFIMGLAGKLYTGTNSANYTSSAHTAALDIQSAVQSGGSLPYIVGYNAAPVYTPTVINYLSRYYTATGDVTAKDTLVATKAYFPRALMAPGVAEYSSAPWFKHFGGLSISAPGYIDVIASVTDDAENAFLAQQLISRNQITSLDAYIAVSYWKSLSGTAPRDNILFPDRDIGGARGRFTNFSWVTTTGPGQDTIAGAFTTTTNVLSNSSLEALNPDTGYFPSCFGWEPCNGSPTWASVDTVAHAGSQSIKLHSGASDRGAIRYGWQSVNSGDSYTATSWFYTPASGGVTTPAAIMTRIIAVSATNSAVAFSAGHIVNASGGVAVLSGGNITLTPSLLSPGTWQCLSVTFVIPAGAAKISLEDFNAYGNGDVYFDDITLQNVSTGQATAPAAFDASLLLVSPEVGLVATLSPSQPLCTQAAYTAPNSYPKAVMVGAYGDFAVSSVQYTPCKPAIYPAQGVSTNWQVRQSWLGLSNHLIGRVTMTSLTTHTDPWVRMRLVTVPLGYLTSTSASSFYINGLKLTLLANNFPTMQIQPAEITDVTGSFPCADELVLSSPTTSFNANQTYYDVALNAQPSSTAEPTGYQSLTCGTLLGYRVTAEGKTYDVWMNPSTSSQTLSYPTPTNPNGFQTLSDLYLSSTSSQTIHPTLITTGTASGTIPGNGMACVVTTPNLILNPGFERLQTSGVPSSDSFINNNGSPVIAVDSAVAHTGSNSVGITCTASDRGEVMLTRVNNTGGRKYTWTIWYRVNSAAMTTSAVQTRLMFWKNLNGSAETDKVPATSIIINSTSNATCTISGNNLGVSPAVLATPGQWASFSVTFTMPATAIQLSAECFNVYGNGKVWYDDASLIQTP